MASAMLMCRGVESIGLLVLVHVSANAKGGERVIAQTAAIMNHNEVNPTSPTLFIVTI